MTAVALLFTAAGVLLRATADAVEAFGKSIAWQMQPTPVAAVALWLDHSINHATTLPKGGGK